MSRAEADPPPPRKKTPPQLGQRRGPGGAPGSVQQRHPCRLRRVCVARASPRRTERSGRASRGAPCFQTQLPRPHPEEAPALASQRPLGVLSPLAPPTPRALGAKGRTPETFPQNWGGERICQAGRHTDPSGGGGSFLLPPPNATHAHATIRRFRAPPQGRRPQGAPPMTLGGRSWTTYPFAHRGWGRRRKGRIRVGVGRRDSSPQAQGGRLRGSRRAERADGPDSALNRFLARSAPSLGRSAC